MRLERIGDEDAEARCRREVRIDLAVGVDEESDPGVRIGDQVARVSEPRVEELLDQQGARTLARAGRISVAAAVGPPWPPARAPLRPGPCRSRGDRGDRKSTRLNSSHRCISYAVFCLK